MKLRFLPLLFSVVYGYEDTCTPFHEIYKDGTELCQVMWDDAFEVVDDEDRGYTMWFFDHENNPNDDTTRLLWGNDKKVDQCHLNYFHKDAPSPEGDGMGDCHPWKNRACCDSKTVGSVDQINEAYGEGYEWNRCGKMSQACERFFVMEACFYECEPNAGLYRKYNSTQKDKHPEYNEWQLHKMPVKKSFCNAWYDACYNDYFCGKGNYFECQAYYNQKLIESKEAEQNAEDEKERNLLIGASVAGAVAVVGLFAAGYLVCRERSGEPVFAPTRSEIS